jgi:hypothetical protein
LDDKVAFEKFKAACVKNSKIVPFKNVRTTEGHLTLGFDPKTNNLLYRTQKHLSQVQPSIKKYFPSHSASTKISKLQQLLYRLAATPSEASPKNARLWTKSSAPSARAASYHTAPTTSSRFSARL